MKTYWRPFTIFDDIEPGELPLPEEFLILMYHFILSPPQKIFEEENSSIQVTEDLYRRWYQKGEYQSIKRIFSKYKDQFPELYTYDPSDPKSSRQVIFHYDGSLPYDTSGSKGYYKKIHTDFIDAWFFPYPEALITFCFLYFRAWINGSRLKDTTPIRTGQAFFGIRHLAAELNISVSKLRTVLRKLSDTGFIELHPNKKGTIYSIKNYSEVQRNKRSFVRPSYPGKEPSVNLKINKRSYFNEPKE